MAFKPLRSLNVGTIEYPPQPSEGGLTFTPNGMIAPWYAANLAMFRTDADVSAFTPDLVITNDNTGKHSVYFKGYDHARVAAKSIDSKLIVNNVWRITAQIKDIVNIDPEKFQFGTTISHDTQITGWRAKGRHAWNLYALPSAVAAIAEFAGVTVPANNPLRELLFQDVVFDTNLMHMYIGDPEASNDSPLHWSKSKLGMWRAELWRALGETDVQKSAVVGDDKFQTKAEALRYCLDVAGTSWQHPQWARVVNVPDARVDAVSGAGKRFNIGCIWQFFTDKAEALREVDSDTPVSANTDAPGVPAEWKEIPDEWLASVADAIAAGGSDIKIAKDMSLTLPLGAKTVGLWRAYLNI